MDTLYTAVAHATGDGRNGHVRSDDGVLDLDLPRPQGARWARRRAPQSRSSLFAGRVRRLLPLGPQVRRRGATRPTSSDSEVSATVGIGPSGAGFGLAVELDVHIPNLDEAAAKALVDKAHQVCPYSNATRGNVDVQLRIV